MWLNVEVEGAAPHLTRTRRAPSLELWKARSDLSHSPHRTHLCFAPLRLQDGPRSRRKRNVDASTFTKEAASVELTIGEGSEIHPRLLPKEVDQLPKPGTISIYTGETDTDTNIIEEVVLSSPSSSHTSR
jgi:hypothetical protein